MSQKRHKARKKNGPLNGGGQKQLPESSSKHGALRGAKCNIDDQIHVIQGIAHNVQVIKGKRNHKYPPLVITGLQHWQEQRKYRNGGSAYGAPFLRKKSAKAAVSMV